MKKLIKEDAPTNNASSGMVAGLDNNPPGRSKLISFKKILKRKKDVRCSGK